LMRAAMCVVVRDLVVFGVLTDMMRGRPIVYATFASYDEVAHHSGLERADTMEALRKLDQQFGRIARARRYAPRPYELVVLSDRDVVVLGSGNLGLVYLMEEPRRLTLEEIEARHPALVDALRGHEHIGWVLAHSGEHGAVVLGPRGTRYLEEDRVEGEDPLAP